jgi:hypothetical protein
MEFYFFMGAVSYPRRVSYARYGQAPIGNLGNDEALALYDVSFGGQLVKSRALTWASELPGFPDLGVNFLPSLKGAISRRKNKVVFLRIRMSFGATTTTMSLPVL